MTAADDDDANVDYSEGDDDSYFMTSDTSSLLIAPKYPISV